MKKVKQEFVEMSKKKLRAVFNNWVSSQLEVKSKKKKRSEQELYTFNENLQKNIFVIFNVSFYGKCGTQL